MNEQIMLVTAPTFQAESTWKPQRSGWVCTAADPPIDWMKGKELKRVIKAIDGNESWRFEMREVIRLSADDDGLSAEAARYRDHCIEKAAANRLIPSCYLWEIGGSIEQFFGFAHFLKWRDDQPIS